VLGADWPAFSCRPKSLAVAPTAIQTVLKVGVDPQWWTPLRAPIATMVACEHDGTPGEELVTLERPVSDDLASGIDRIDLDEDVFQINYK